MSTYNQNRVTSLKSSHRSKANPYVQTLSSLEGVQSLSMSVERGQLLRVQQTRQVMEKDERMLENRIKMLQHEEQKLLRKIEMTRKQAEKLMAVKQRNDEEQRQKMEQHLHQDNSMDNFRELKRLEKEQSKKRYLEYSRSIYEDKRQSYLSIRNNRLEGEQSKEHYLEAVRQANKERKAQIRQQEQLAREKLTSIWNQRVEKSQLNYLEKLDRQKQVIQDKAQKISKMEEMEASLLKKLQNTQIRHRETFNMLENAMKSMTIGIKNRLTQSVDTTTSSNKVASETAM